MVDSAYNTDASFVQNFNAARESALISRLSRSKDKINEAKIALQTLNPESKEFAKMEEMLVVERSRYFQVLNQLNKLRNYHNQEAIKDLEDASRQKIRYVSDRDLFTNAVHTMVPKKQYDYQNDPTYDKFTKTAFATRSNVVDTMVF